MSYQENELAKNKSARMCRSLQIDVDQFQLKCDNNALSNLRKIVKRRGEGGIVYCVKHTF